MSLINQTSAAVMEQFANRLLNLDAEAQDKLSIFSDKVIHVHIEDFDLNYFFLFPGKSLVVQTSSQRKPSAIISGKSTAFIAAIGDANNESMGDAIFTGELHFSGEINTARRFQEFAQNLEIDWQEPLSQIFGDTVGHHIGQAFSHTTHFFKQLLSAGQQDIPDYLQYEIQATPSATELSNYCEQVDRVRSQTDRLQARINQLKQLRLNND